MNKFQFMGRLTKEPEVRNTTTGTKITIITLALNRKFTNADGKRETDFFNIMAFGKTGEFISKYFKKGKQVLVEGRIQDRTWEDKGQKHYSTDFIAEQVYFADSAEKNETSLQVYFTDSTEKNETSLEDAEYITIEDPSDLPF